MEDIILELTVLTRLADGSLQIAGLGIRLLGKNADEFTYLMLWRNNTHPHLCGVRLLCTYLALTGLTHGPLFPCQFYPTTNRDDVGHQRDSISMKAVYQANKTALVNVLKLVVGLGRPYGMHTLRRTGYVLAVWGGAEIGSIMQAARHAKWATACLYFDQAQTALQRARANK